LADLKLTVNFTPESGSIADLQKQVQAAFGAPVKIKFQADVTGDMKSQLNTQKLATAESRSAITAARLLGVEQDNLAKRSRAEAAATNAKVSALRLQNAETAKAEKATKQAAVSERRARQNDVDYQYLKRQSQDYYNQNQKNIRSNKELSASWDDYMKNAGDKSKWKDPLDNRNRLNELKDQTREAGLEIETLGQRIKRLFGQHFDTALVMVGINAMRQALQLVYKNVVELDGAVVDLQIATGGSRSDMQALLSDYSKIGQEMGATTLEVAQASDSFLRQGKSLQETETLVRNSTMLSKLGKLESESASEYLTSTMKGYKIAVDDSLGIVDKLTAVDMAAAIDAGEIAEGLSRTAVSADVAGVSLNKLIGYVATVGEVTQASGDEVGTFYKTLFARMGNVKAGNLIDAESGDILSNVESVLTGYGVKLRDSNSEFRNFGDVLDEVASKWDSYGTVAQRAIAVAFSGTRQQEKFCYMESPNSNVGL